MGLYVLAHDLRMKLRKGELAAREPHGEVVPVPPLAPELRPAPPGRARRLPAGVYLARLAPGSRRTIRYALDTLAALLTVGHLDAETLP